MRVLVARGRRVSLLLVRGRSRGLLIHVGSKAAILWARDNQGCQSGWEDGVLPLPAAQTYKEGLPPKTGIPGFRDSVVPVSSGTGEDTVYSSHPSTGQRSQY